LTFAISCLSIIEILPFVQEESKSRWFLAGQKQAKVKSKKAKKEAILMQTSELKK
jgi:hypothetical protein